MRATTRYAMRSAALFCLAVMTVASSARAQTLDRDKAPVAGNSPTLKVPTWTKTKLANGAELIVVQKHDLPLVAVNIDFVGGSSNYEPADRTGVAALAAQMLSEGTKTKTADQLSEAQQLLGTTIVSNVGSESGTIRFTSLARKMEPAMALLSDMLVNSTFPDSSLERIRGRVLVALTQARDQPNAIAANVFATVLYGDEHPYGRVASERSVKAITRADIVAFATTYFRPGRAVITIAGDIEPARARRVVERTFAAWPAGGERPSFSYGAVPTAKARTIYLVDKPKAAQSVFAFGEPGPTRSTPDYFALQVMNRLLGGMFQSRLNHDIREVKGYSYAVNSSFGFGHGPGPFRAGGGIVSAKTDSALIAFMTHFKGVQGAMPFTDDEVTMGKESLIQAVPGAFSTVERMAGAISSIYTQDLPETYFKDFASRVNAVTKADLARVAQRYIDVDHMNLVIVGDRASIEGPLKATGIAPIQVMDVDGRPALVP